MTFDLDEWQHPLLPSGAVLHVCLNCGAVIPAKGTGMHQLWHERIAKSAIDAHARIDRLEGGTR